jgi:chromosome segregation ATPase
MPDPYPLLPLPEPLTRAEGLAEKAAAHLADCAQYAADVAALEQRREQLPRELMDAGAGFKEIDRARRELTDAHIANQRRLVELWTARAELLRAAHPAIADQLAATQSRLETTRDKISKALGKCGLRAENDPQHAANPAAAEQRFANQRDQHPEVRSLLGRIDELSSAARLAPPQSAQAQQLADAAGRRLLVTYANLSR